MSPLRGNYPVLCSERVAESRDFYVRHFGFEVSFDSEWYVSLKHGQRAEYELALLDVNHPTIPDAGRKVVGGVLLILAVAAGLTDYLVYAEVPTRLVAWTQSHIHSRLVFLLGLSDGQQLFGEPTQ